MFWVRFIGGVAANMGFVAVLLVVFANPWLPVWALLVGLLVLLFRWLNRVSG